jgi:hypothetical protein
MVKFNDDHKQEMGNYFEFGVHEVKIGLVEFGKTEDKEPREYVEFTVVDDLNSENPKEAKARMWFTTEKAIKYTFSIIRGLFTHNAPDDKKDAIKEQVNKVSDTTEMEKLCQKLVGKDAYLEVSEDPSRTYTDKKSGEEKKSINRNITGYKPTPKAVTAAPAATTAPSSEAGDDSPMADF